MTALDTGATSYLVVVIGTDPLASRSAMEVVAEAEAVAATTLVVVDSMSVPDDRALLGTMLGKARVGVRIVVVGGRYDVLQALALCRRHGALPHELTGRITHTRDLPLYCAHCRDTHRVAADPGGEVLCPGCARHLEIHDHASAVRGSYLASDARARELV